MSNLIHLLWRSAPAWALASIASTGFALAQPAEGGAGGPPPRPPAEALAACKSAKAGADCSFSLGERKQQGSCWAPEGKPLACRPKGPPPPAAGGASAPAWR